MVSTNTAFYLRYRKFTYFSPLSILSCHISILQRQFPALMTCPWVERSWFHLLLYPIFWRALEMIQFFDNSLNDLTDFFHLEMAFYNDDTLLSNIAFPFAPCQIYVFASHALHVVRLPHMKIHNIYTDMVLWKLPVLDWFRIIRVYSLFLTFRPSGCSCCSSSFGVL